jgi:hypothetical protein
MFLVLITFLQMHFDYYLETLSPEHRCSKLQNRLNKSQRKGKAAKKAEDGQVI